MSSVPTISLFDALKYKGYNGLTDKGKKATKIGLGQSVGGVALIAFGVGLAALAMITNSIGLMFGSAISGGVAGGSGLVLLVFGPCRLFDPLTEKENRQFIQQHNFTGIALTQIRDK